MTALPPGVTYEPGTLICRWHYAYDPFRRERIIQGLCLCPAWSITGEDGTTLTVYREEGEVNGFAASPDGTKRRAWDMGRGGEHTPLAASLTPDIHGPNCHPHEIAAMNRILRTTALARPWEDLLPEATPCDHTSRWCALTEEGAA